MRAMSAATQAAGRPLPDKGPCAALRDGRCGSSTAKLLRCMSPEVAGSVAKVFLQHGAQFFRPVGAAIE